jgi:hypothetical protein
MSVRDETESRDTPRHGRMLWSMVRCACRLPALHGGGVILQLIPGHLERPVLGPTFCLLPAAMLNLSDARCDTVCPLIGLISPSSPHNLPNKPYGPTAQRLQPNDPSLGARHEMEVGCLETRSQSLESESLGGRLLSRLRTRASNQLQLLRSPRPITRFSRGQLRPLR